MMTDLEKKDDWSDRFSHILDKSSHETKRVHVNNLTERSEIDKKTPNTFQSRLDRGVKSEGKTSKGSDSPYKERRIEAYSFDKGKLVCNNCHQHVGSNKEERVNTAIKVIVNSTIGIIMLGAFIFISYMIFDDVSNKLDSEIQFEAARINQCQKDYEENRCESHNRLPALEEFCQEKDHCRFENPRSVVMKSRAVTILVAEVINGFINTLELKSIIVLFTFIFGLILVFNCSLGYCSRKRNIDHEIAGLRKELFSNYQPHKHIKCKSD